MLRERIRRFSYPAFRRLPNMKTRLFFCALVSAALAATISCGKGGSAGEIVVGEYGSLTGGIATFGISTRDGSQRALDEVNGAGGVLGQKIKLLVEDDQSKPAEASTGVTKLI